MYEQIKNLKIGKKLSLSMTILTVLMILSAAVSIVSMLVTRSQIEKFQEGVFREKEYVMDMNRLFERTQKGIFMAIIAEDQKDLDEFIQIAKESVDALSVTEEKLEKIYTGDRALIWS